MPSRLHALTPVRAPVCVRLRLSEAPFSAKPLVYSAAATWIRHWWNGTARKLELVDGKTKHAHLAKVLARSASRTSPRLACSD
eukprot:4820341-Pleurochrysis_carterae.AAC.4